MKGTMKTRRVLRHYCDHCHRGKFSKPDMERHEKVCFHNPHRDCCECDAENTDAVGNAKWLEFHGQDGLAELKRRVNGCPACTMSVVIQHNKTNHGEDFILYDTYKQERDAYRGEKFRKENGVF
jgi:hypothetical protein